ncbi:MAG: beta-hydroxyacyl-ACP dehydratase [Anditalea sp.]
MKYFFGIGVKSFGENDAWLKGSFPAFGYIPGMILIESMAQCGGAGVKLLGIAEGVFALTSIEHLRFFQGAEYNSEFKYVIQNLRISSHIIKQSGNAYMAGQQVMEATWMSVKVK